MARSRLALALILAVAAAFALACTSPAAAPTPSAGSVTAAAGSATSVAKSKAPDQLRVAVGAMPATPDPGGEVSLLAKVVYNLVFDRLFDRDDKGQPIPALAESWRNVDPITWEFKLRRDVKFANGEAFNAAAVKASLDRLKNPDNKLANAQRFTAIDRAEVVDDTTVRFITREPIGTLFAALSWLEIAPPNLAVERYADFLRAPLGTGPYLVETWTQNDRVVLKPNPQSWRGAPPISQVTIRHIPEEATRVAGVQSGDLEIAYAVPVESTDALRQGGYTVTAASIGQTEAIYFRQGDSPIDDKRVRQAIASSLDPAAIIKNTVGGLPKAVNQIAGPDGFGHNPSLPPYPRDIPQARRLLAEAGHSNLTIKLDTPQGRYLKDREISEAVAGQLKEAGVNVELQVLEFAVYLQNFLGGKTSPMFLAGVSYAPELDINQPLSFFTTANSAKLASNTDYDALIARSIREPNQTEREKLLQQAQKYLYDEVWAVYLFQIPTINAASASAASITFRPDYSMNLSALSP